MYFTLVARNLNEAVNMSVASILQFFSLCLSSFAQLSSTRRLSQHRRRSSDVPGFVYVFHVDDGSDHLLFKVGYTKNLDRRRRQWRKHCFPICHFWSHLRSLRGFPINKVGPSLGHWSVLILAEMLTHWALEANGFRRTHKICSGPQCKWRLLYWIPLSLLLSGSACHREIFEYLGQGNARTVRKIIYCIISSVAQKLHKK